MHLVQISLCTNKSKISGLKGMYVPLHLMHLSGLLCRAHMKVKFCIPHQSKYYVLYLYIHIYTNTVYILKQVTKVMIILYYLFFIFHLHFFPYYSGFLKIMVTFVLFLYFKCFIFRENVITKA